MAWCYQVIIHYLNQCWPSSVMSKAVTMLHWVNKYSKSNCFTPSVRYMYTYIFLQRTHGPSCLIGTPMVKSITTLPTSLVLYAYKPQFEGILPKGPYLPCVSMAGRALLAGYPRIMHVSNAKLWFVSICLNNRYIDLWNTTHSSRRFIAHMSMSLENNSDNFAFACLR